MLKYRWYSRIIESLIERLLLVFQRFRFRHEVHLEAYREDRSDPWQEGVDVSVDTVVI